MIHISDREAFALLDVSQRTLFIGNFLVSEIKILSAEIAKESLDQFQEKFFKNFKSFLKEFSAYKQGTTEHLTENLYYMFAKRIAKHLRGEESAVLISHIFLIIISAETFLNIPRVIKN